jgi:hypothetical protein
MLGYGEPVHADVSAMQGTPTTVMPKRPAIEISAAVEARSATTGDLR